MSFRIDTRKLWKARAPAIQRLARFLGVPTPPDNCDCEKCRGRLVELLGSRLLDDPYLVRPHVPSPGAEIR